MRFDDIMDAMKALDGEAAGKPQYGKLINRARPGTSLTFHLRSGP